jgi:CRISPR-associated endonuclease/helicase Cas3
VTDQRYAHSGASGDASTWHRLSDHLQRTADRARAFAGAWGASDWGFLAGLWHDVGKYADDWQSYLVHAGARAGGEDQDASEVAPVRRRRGPDHSSAGAIHVLKRFKTLSLPLQFAIAGHHAGLADRADLESRLRERQPRYDCILQRADPGILEAADTLDLPAFITAPGSSEERRRRLETFTRMLFSALVDADFLDTEQHFFASTQRGGSSPAEQRAAWSPLQAYLPVLEEHLAALEKDAQATTVNTYRRRVRQWCQETALGPKGAYTLTVPTGGGKTLSSLLFALSHASKWRLHRIVVALPFISILDQTARIFREIFEPALGPNILVEHHHAIEPVRDTTMNRLASENWDAPLIVTTQVQLFESLFSRRYSRCRKLHNLTDSVLILDEVQTLPASLLSPIVDMLQDLQTHYGVSLLLTTATQPSLHTRPLGPWRFDGLDPKPVEIVPEPEIADVFAAFRRVQVRWPETNACTNWVELAATLSRHRQVLAIVHRRQDAAELWIALRNLAGDDTLHLSALMCPAHRRQVLSEIRARLDDGAECRVVSTQVVEAGVDVDFPIVYRAMAGLEALAQSAGRCNREGRLPTGQFEVFHPPTEPPGILRLHRDLALVMLDEDPSLDLMAPATFRIYFDRLYSARSRDARGIQALREAFRFEETASRFRMIDSAAEQVFVPFERDGERAVAALRYGGPSRDRFRALQPFGVAIYPQDLREIVSSGAVELLHDSVYVLVDKSLYDGRLGLRSAPEPADAWIA